jgi:PAS domain S-box-containing protein
MESMEQKVNEFLSVTGLTEKLIESSLDGIVGFDTNYNYTIFNPAMERISGMKQAEVMGRNAFETFPFLIDVGEDEHFKKALQGQPSLSEDRQFVVPETGRTGMFEALYSPLYDKDRKIVGGFAIVREVSEWKRTQRDLKETELKLRQLNQVTSDAIITCDSKGEILSWNKSAEVIFGYTSTEDTPKSLEIILPDFRWESEVKLLRVSDWPERSFRMDGIRKNGSNIPLQLSSSRWRFGDKVFLTISLRDLTELTHLESKADEHRELSESLMQVHNELHQGLVAVEFYSHKPVYINQAYADMLGYTIEELMAFPTLLKLIRPDLLPLIEKRIAHRIEIGKETDFTETILVHKKGFDIHVEVGVKEVETSSGRVSFCLIRNITHRKMREAALLRSERQFRFIFEKARSIICVLEPDGSITNINPAFEKILGFSRLEWIGKPLCLLVHPEDTTKLLECLKEAIDPNEECETKIRLINSKNKIVPVEISATATTEVGKIDALMLVIRPTNLKTKNH